MDTLWLELFIVLLLILANGFFAGAELAIVSVRRGRIAQLAAAGSKSAQIVEQLHADPHRFLATVQIGVTLVGTLASAVGGAAAVEVIKPVLKQVPLAFVSNSAEPLALFLVVGVIAYLSLILGELVPKALALAHAERLALAVARPIGILARIGNFAVCFLTVSSRAVLTLLGIRAQGGQAFITKEEIQQLVAEGRELGVVSPREQEIIRNVFEYSKTRVREVMVPRPRVVALDLANSREQLLQMVFEHQYSRYPVYRNDPESILGFLHAKDLFGQAVRGAGFDLEKLLRPACFVPESKKIDELLRDMQRRHVHMAVVIDEYGGVSGIVTTEDLLEELVGEIEDEHDQSEPARIRPLKSGGYLVDGLLPLNDLADLLGVHFPQDRPYETLAGLILFELGHLPVEGEQLQWGGYLLTCTKVRQTAIEGVKIEPHKRKEPLQEEP
ncbi:transporter [Desulfuromonas versatilis]|uniref:Transporter n=1 Tax=Desulfuromonas versatilis TaxID=2802975 RepID=A0ABM8HRD8_9BACT|nr:hemolysin family protein [Desulfuromonas versatilis]BCR03165.1 transporter [Desulfuromonas versatilis]